MHYQVHNTPPMGHLLSQINPVHNILFYLCKIYFNIIIPSTTMSSKSFLSLWFSNYSSVAYAFLFPSMFVTHLNQTMCLVWLPKYHCMETVSTAKLLLMHLPKPRLQIMSEVRYC